MNLDIKLPKKLNIKVTKNDIKMGKREDGENCPIALCLQRELQSLGDVETVDVSDRHATASLNIPLMLNGETLGQIHCELEADLGKKANTFINKFDNMDSVSPIALAGALRITSTYLD